MCWPSTRAPGRRAARRRAASGRWPGSGGVTPPVEVRRAAPAAEGRADHRLPVDAAGQVGCLVRTGDRYALPGAAFYEAAGAERTAHVYPDRPLYRPGQPRFYRGLVT